MSMDFSFITGAVTIAIECIALLEAIKVFFKKKSCNIPSWIYTVLSVILSFGLALIQCSAFTWAEIKVQLPIGLLAFSISQLGYDSIWKAVKKKINALAEDGNE